MVRQSHALSVRRQAHPYPHYVVATAFPWPPILSYGNPSRLARHFTVPRHATARTQALASDDTTLRSVRAHALASCHTETRGPQPHAAVSSTTMAIQPGHARAHARLPHRATALALPIPHRVIVNPAAASLRRPSRPPHACVTTRVKRALRAVPPFPHCVRLSSQTALCARALLPTPTRAEEKHAGLAPRPARRHTRPCSRSLTHILWLCPSFASAPLHTCTCERSLARATRQRAPHLRPRHSFACRVCTRACVHPARRCGAPRCLPRTAARRTARVPLPKSARTHAPHNFTSGGGGGRGGGGGGRSRLRSSRR